MVQLEGKEEEKEDRGVFSSRDQNAVGSAPAQLPSPGIAMLQNNTSSQYCKTTFKNNTSSQCCKTTFKCNTSTPYNNVTPQWPIINPPIHCYAGIPKLPPIQVIEKTLKAGRQSGLRLTQGK